MTEKKYPIYLYNKHDGVYVVTIKNSLWEKFLRWFTKHGCTCYGHYYLIHIRKDLHIRAPYDPVKDADLIRQYPSKKVWQ